MNPSPPANPTPHLILGGARSGKSTYAESLLLQLPPTYVYVATATVLDAEMESRVRTHRDRRGSDWKTVECPRNLTHCLDSLNGSSSPVLVDCLTLWLTNLILDPQTRDPAPFLDALCRTIASVDYPLYLVSNEVGAGIVPENELARRFRDWAGWTNQRVATVCSSVTLVVAGLPLSLKRPGTPS
ncbi:MAG: bifunctional adenosylcobinamide kinase/adenosylcobinamide-phosphate guanylyltransferase [Syntrophobacteraceae bacterium]